jgi:hypothetical protein
MDVDGCRPDEHLNGERANLKLEQKAGCLYDLLS